MGNADEAENEAAEPESGTRPRDEGNLRVEILRLIDAAPARLRELRLQSLQTDPDAFGGTYERAAAQDDRVWEEWVAASDAGVTQRTFLLVSGSSPQEDWLGLALVRVNDENNGVATLNAFWVSPGVRGQGAGQMLCQACLVWARAAGCSNAMLSVVVGNQAALRTYEVCGFEICGRDVITMHGRELDEFFMTRSLP